MRKSNSPIAFPFLSTFLIILSLFTTDAANPVLDTEGQNLQTSNYYYILPAISGSGGGGLTTGANHNATAACPLAVVQDQNELNSGLPLTFSPANLTETVVRVSADLNIKFSSRAATVCEESNVWTFTGSIGERFVITGGVEGNPGRETLTNWFSIAEHEDYYKLFYCPTVCETCRVACGDLGIYVDEDGTRRLAESEVPFKVMFKKV